MEFQDFAARLFCALALGAAIGVERQWRQSLAGIRTYALVSAGAAMFVLMSINVSDPSGTRVAAQVASGIGFLGAGVIMRDGTNVRGLTTAAGLWCAAAIGTIAAIGAFNQAALAAVAVLIVNIVLRPLKSAVDRVQESGAETRYSYELKLVCRAKREAQVRAQLLTATHGSDLALRSISSSPDADLDRSQLRAEFEVAERCDDSVRDIVTQLTFDPLVQAISWEVEEDTVIDVDEPTSFFGRLVNRQAS